jgi:acetoin utilization protein AcuB
MERLAETPISQIMTGDPASVGSEQTLDDVLFLFDRHKVGALPVLDDQGVVVGMFSIRDLIKAYTQLFGLGERGSALIEVEDDGQPHLLTRIVQALEERDIPFTRLVRATADGTTGVVYVRVHTFNIHGIREALKSRGLRVGS